MTNIYSSLSANIAGLGGILGSTMSTIFGNSLYQSSSTQYNVFTAQSTEGWPYFQPGTIQSAYTVLRQPVPRAKKKVPTVEGNPWAGNPWEDQWTFGENEEWLDSQIERIRVRL